MKPRKNNVSLVAIFTGIGEICVYRGYQAPKTYKYSNRRAALLRAVIRFNFEYNYFSTWALEKFRIEKPKNVIYHN